jgi:CNT family concentrative nucleoside transporter
VMAAPGALVITKLMYPEEEQSETRGTVRVQIERPWVNFIDAAASGAGDGVKLAINVAAMLIAFLALLALVNGLLGWIGGVFGLPGLSLELLFSYALAPVAWLMGVPWSEAGQVGVLLGKKTVLNEFIAYMDLKTLLDNAKSIATGTATAGSLPTLSDRSVVLATYALCGFANIGSIGIQIGGIGPLMPGRQRDLARLGARALLAGAMTNFINACIAGMLI